MIIQGKIATFYVLRTSSTIFVTMFDDSDEIVCRQLEFSRIFTDVLKDVESHINSPESLPIFYQNLRYTKTQRRDQVIHIPNGS